MKKGKLYVLAGVLAVLGLTGCSETLVDDFGNEPGSEVQGYLSLNLAGANAPLGRTSANGNPGDSEGTESDIANVTVVLTDVDGKITKSTSPSLSGLQTEAFKVAVGTHYVYVLVNDPGVAVDVNTNINELIQAASTAAEATDGYKGGSFLMVNEHHSSTANAGVSVDIAATNTITNPSKVTIKVDRVSAKIADATTTPTIDDLKTKTNNFIETVDVKGFVLLNVRKQFNLVQKWGVENYGGATLENEVLTGVALTSDLVKENFFHSIADYTTITRDAGGDVTEIANNSDIADYTKDVKYTTENRPAIKFFGTENDKLTSGRGETTGVIYGVQAMNAGVAIPTFYVYKDAIYADYATLAAHADFVGVTLPTESAKLRGLGIKVYENGIMYYTYFINDKNANHQYDSKNYNAVFRNSMYKLTINSIKNIGDDVPGGGTVDPEKPGEPENPDIDTEDAYIQVTVDVNPWVLNNIGIDF